MGFTFQLWRVWRRLRVKESCKRIHLWIARNHLGRLRKRRARIRHGCKGSQEITKLSRNLTHRADSRGTRRKWTRRREQSSFKDLRANVERIAKTIRRRDIRGISPRLLHGGGIRTKSKLNRHSPGRINLLLAVRNGEWNLDRNMEITLFIHKKDSLEANGVIIERMRRERIKVHSRAEINSDLRILSKKNTLIMSIVALSLQAITESLWPIRSNLLSNRQANSSILVLLSRRALIRSLYPWIASI